MNRNSSVFGFSFCKHIRFHHIYQEQQVHFKATKKHDVMTGFPTRIPQVVLGYEYVKWTAPVLQVTTICAHQMATVPFLCGARVRFLHVLSLYINTVDFQGLFLKRVEAWRSPSIPLPERSINVCTRRILMTLMRDGVGAQWISPVIYSARSFTPPSLCRFVQEDGNL